MRQLSLLSSPKVSPPPTRINDSDFCLSRTELHDYSNDPISCLSVNRNIPFLALGTKSGKVSVYSTENEVPKIYCQFTSHEAEFDYLKSVEILEKINCLEWLPQIGPSLNILTANERTIKHWRLSERNHEICDPDQSEENPPFPKFRKPDNTRLHVQTRKNYLNAHTYFINSLVANNDQLSFYSSDDLQINQWNLDYKDSAHVIVDLKPDNLEDLAEIITSLKVQPNSSSLFAYSLSTGKIRLCDTRIKSNCDLPIAQFVSSPTEDSRFFKDIVSSINDIRYSLDGTRIIARDYLTLMEWDLRYAKECIKRFDVQSELNSEMCYLYEINSIFDKFQCSWACDDKYLVTGSYGNTVKIFDSNQEESGSLFSLDDSFITEEDLSVINPGPANAKSCCIVTPNEMIGKHLNITHLTLLPMKDYKKVCEKMQAPSENQEKNPDTPSEVRGSKKRKQSIRMEMNSFLGNDYTTLDVSKPILLLASDPRRDSIYIAADNRLISCCLKPKPCEDMELIPVNNNNPNSPLQPLKPSTPPPLSTENPEVLADEVPKLNDNPRKRKGSPEVLLKSHVEN